MSSNQRIVVLDALRGFAILGILLVNIAAFQRTPYALSLLPPDPLQGGAAVLDFVLQWLVQGKFYTLFSLLFGAGFIIFFERAQQRSSHPNRLFLRRLVGLLLIGAVHLLFIWSGDILVTYALAGVALLLVTNLEAKKLVQFAIFLWVAYLIILLGSGAMAALMMQSGDGATAFAEIISLREQQQTALLAAEPIYQTGSYIEVLTWRWQELAMLWSYTLQGIPLIFSVFLLGAAMAKAGWFYDLAKQRSTFKRLVICGFIIGLPSAAWFAANVAIMRDPEQVFTLNYIWVAAVQLISNLAVTLAYVGVFALCAIARQRWLTWFAPVGKLALSNYLLQSIVFTVIFYGYGLGWYAQGAWSLWVLLGLGVYLLQMLISHLWLKRFTQGPMEALWRRFTYWGTSS